MSNTLVALHSQYSFSIPLFSQMSGHRAPPVTSHLKSIWWIIMFDLFQGNVHVSVTWGPAVSAAGSQPDLGFDSLTGTLVLTPGVPANPAVNRHLSVDRPLWGTAWEMFSSLQLGKYTASQRNNKLLIDHVTSLEQNFPWARLRDALYNEKKQEVNWFGGWFNLYPCLFWLFQRYLTAHKTKLVIF